MRLVLLALALAALGAGLWLATRPPVVAVAAVRRGTAAEVVYAAGVVEPVRWAAIAPLSRARIAETCACEGETVAAGAPLLRLDAAAAARAQAAELDARLRLAERALERAEELVARRAAPVERQEAAEALVLELSAARAAAQVSIDELTLRAPLDGVVLRMDAIVGEVAEPGVALAWVGEPRPLRVEAEVNEEDIPRIRVDQRALLGADAFPGEALEATVAAVTPKGDPGLRTWRVRLALPEDTPLMIGMTVEVNVVIRESLDAVLAPAAAVVDGAVFAVEAGRLRRTPVDVGIATPETVELRDGPPTGTEVVSPASAALRDGARVRLAE